ncbi:MAG: membrane protein [Rhizobiaceae bacterium MnEN-MB40S]|nr:MAG: membrane protein [Rhizobiaceae bacterium MnEN-MB40S]
MKALLTIVAAAVIAAGLLASPASAQSRTPRLDIGISTNVIPITSDFAGEDLTVFGAIDGADPELLRADFYDVVVTLEGPSLESVVRKKARVFGIWINRSSMRFEPAPVSYSLSSTLPVELIADSIELSDLGIGVQNIRLTPTGAIGDGSATPEFRNALLRLRTADGLYQRDPIGVEYVSSSLFRATLRLPANVPVGEHKLRAFLFQGGKFVMERELPLSVVKTGVEQFIFEYAHQHSLIYGLFAVLLAMITGWLGSVLFRKD